MKIQTTRFVCDQCSKQDEKVEIEGQHPFDYGNGWMYLYNLNWKAAKGDSQRGVQSEVRDKHFCSLKCMLEHVASLLQQSREEVNNVEQPMDKA